MGWVDLVPRAGPLYIGGLYALYQTDLIRAAHITHVVSVIDYDPLLQEQFQHLQHFHIRVEDHPNADLLQWFERGVKWVDGALSGGGELEGEEKEAGEKQRGVFVHCAMGKSRSATIVVAYLMWKYHLDAKTALEQLCEGRPVCDPNPGFKEQLEVWGRMCKAGNEEEKKALYEEWAKTRFMGEYWEWDKRKTDLEAKAKL